MSTATSPKRISMSSIFSIIEVCFDSNSSNVASSKVTLERGEGYLPAVSLSRRETTFERSLLGMPINMSLAERVARLVRAENVVVSVGVPLLRDIIDMADPGLGLGLGLGGASESVSSDSEEITKSLPGFLSTDI